jgi:hypothetical protein
MLEGKCCVVLRTILGPHVGIEAIHVDRGPSSRAAEAGQDSGSGQGEIGSIDLVHGLLGLVVVKSNFVFFPVLISLRDRDSD